MRSPYAMTRKARCVGKQHGCQTRHASSERPATRIVAQTACTGGAYGPGEDEHFGVVALAAYAGGACDPDEDEHT